MGILIQRILKLSIITCLIGILSSMSIVITSVPAYASSAIVAVNPPNIVNTTLTVGSTFSINITIANFTKLWGYQYAIFYNASVINATNYVKLDDRFTLELPSEIGYNFTAVARKTYDGDTTGITSVDPVPVDRIDFQVTGIGTTNIVFNSPLSPTYTQLAAVGGLEIPTVVVKGFFSNDINAYNELWAAYVHYSQLATNYTNLQMAFNNLNRTYNSLNLTYNNMQKSYQPLLANYTNLQTEHENLQRDYNNLERTYNASFQRDYSFLQDELSFRSNLSYVLIATNIILIATTVYLAISRSRVDSSLVSKKEEMI